MNSIVRKMSKLLPDKAFLKIKFRLKMHKKLNLKDPKMYSEKLQWLKLYDRNPEYTKMVDKYEVKKYVADIIGEEHIIPTLGVYDKFDDIDFDKLPNQFVIKCTHDSGGIVICKDKNTFNLEAAKNDIDKCMKRNYYYDTREWPYKNVKPRIIVEQYMEDNKYHELRDYKFFVFDGQVKLMFVASNRMSSKETCFDFFDEEFNKLSFRNGHPNSKEKIEKPVSFEKMKKMAVQIVKDIPHARVDFYEINGKMYFGEITFYHWSGFMPYEPEIWDYKIGEYLDLGLVKRMKI